jgi:hypothetical protein
MRNFALISFLLVIMTTVPSIGKGTVMTCTYSTGAEIVIDLNKENLDTISIERSSPQKMMKQKIFIKSQSKTSEEDDYLEVESRGKKIVYSLKCKKD